MKDSLHPDKSGPRAGNLFTVSSGISSEREWYDQDLDDGDAVQLMKGDWLFGWRFVVSCASCAQLETLILY